LLQINFAVTGRSSPGPNFAKLLKEGGTVKRHQSRSRNNHGCQMKEGIPGIEEGHADKEENARDYVDDKTDDSPGFYLYVFVSFVSLWFLTFVARLKIDVPWSVMYKVAP